MYQMLFVRCGGGGPGDESKFLISSTISGRIDVYVGGNTIMQSLSSREETELILLIW